MLAQAQKLAPELARLREDIHRHPELCFREFRTAQLVADTLQEIGGFNIKTQVGKTGVTAEIGNSDGSTIAIRADMDALPITEINQTDYVSTAPGIMHACGHDGHTAILLGVAHLLKDSFMREPMAGRVRLLFQPAEEDVDAEGVSGAPRMIEDGALEGVDAVIALHVDPTKPTGVVATNAGWNSAAVDTFEAWLTASSGHGAYPHRATDPLWILGPVLMALHGIVARRIDPMKSAVVSLGQIHAGTTSNVIPSEVYLHGTLRSFDVKVREQLITEVEQALTVARPLGGDYRLKVLRGYPAGWNDPTVNGWLETVATDLLGAEALQNASLGMGAEDFAYMCQKAPGAMFLLGAGMPDGVKRYHHTPNFDINAACLPIGAAILAETACRFLKNFSS